MGKTKKLLSLLLCLAMLCSLLPMAAFAANTTHEVANAAALGTAITSASAYDTIN